MEFQLGNTSNQLQQKTLSILCYLDKEFVLTSKNIPTGTEGFATHKFLPECESNTE